MTPAALAIRDVDPDLVAFLAGPVGTALLHLVPDPPEQVDQAAKVAELERPKAKERQLEAAARGGRSEGSVRGNGTLPSPSRRPNGMLPGTETREIVSEAIGMSTSSYQRAKHVVEAAEMKRCTTCGRQMPASLAYFGPHSSCSDGLRPVCRSCRRTRAVGLRREPRPTVPRQPRPSTPAIEQWCVRYAAEHHCDAEQARDRLTRWPSGCALVHELKRLRRSPYSLPAARAFVRAYREENPFSAVKTALAAYCHSDTDRS